MDLNFTSEQDMLRDSAARFLRSECPYAKVKEIEETTEGYSPGLWDKIIELGWTGLPFPEEYGGYGGQFTDLVIIMEEMGKMAFPSPFFSTVVQSGFTLLEGGSETQKQELLPQISEGSLTMTLAQYEEDASYEENGINLKAEVGGDGYILNGTKMFVLDANIAQKIIVAARTKEGVTLFPVKADDPGITINKMPTIAMDNTCEVILKNVKVSKDDMIGAPGQGWEILEKMNKKAAIAKSAEMIGGCKACIDMTSGYAKERIQYGKPIGGFQIIQHYMANMLIAYDTIWNYLYRVTYLVDEGEDFALAASVLKSRANENYLFISDRAVQIHGGIGTTREYDVALFMRRSKAYEFVAGDTDYHAERVTAGILEHMPSW